MKLYSVTITGISQENDIDELLNLSRRYPWLEWGVLLSESAMGRKPRYPNAEFVQELFEQANRASEGVVHPFRFAAHLCGTTMRKFVTGITPKYDDYGEWIEPFGISEQQANFLFGRVQVNFNSTRENFGTTTMKRMIEGWYEGFDGNLITQHNKSNTWVWEAIQEEEIKMNALRAHHVLHDASGGRGKELDDLPQPIAGVLNGYAGGIGPRNIVTVLQRLDHHIPRGYVWIDMESGVRDDNDQMNMPAIHHMLNELSMIIQDQRWV